MYTKKQKIEIYINFFLAAFAVEIFHVFIARKNILKVYEMGLDLFWMFPLHILFPLWTILYALMAIAGAKVYIKKPSHIRNFALSAWIVQLGLNVLWPASSYYSSIQIISPILVTILFMTIIIFIFYAFLLDKKIVFFPLPFFLMIVYKMVSLWIFYIFNPTFAVMWV